MSRPSRRWCRMSRRAGGGAGCHARAGGGGAGEANHPAAVWRGRPAEIETRRDVDWFKVTLEADTTYNSMSSARR